MSCWIFLLEFPKANCNIKWPNKNYCTLDWQKTLWTLYFCLDPQWSWLPYAQLYWTFSPNSKSLTCGLLTGDNIKAVKRNIVLENVFLDKCTFSELNIVKKMKSEKEDDEISQVCGNNKLLILNYNLLSLHSPKQCDRLLHIPISEELAIRKSVVHSNWYQIFLNSSYSYPM